MPVVSLSQAAKVTGVSKATIHRAIKSGRLTAERQEDGSYRIDPADLNLMYPFLVEGSETALRNGKPVSSNHRPGGSEKAVLEARLAGARKLIEHLEREVADLRTERDGWRQQAETTQRLFGY